MGLVYTRPLVKGLKLHACILEYRSALHINLRCSASGIEVSLLVALFPGLPGFYLMFAFTEVEEQQKGKEKVWSHSSCEWTQGESRGGETNIQICTHKLESQFKSNS